MVRELFQTLYARLSASNPKGYPPDARNHKLHGGLVVKCVGQSEPVFNDDGERTDRHVIGILAGTPDDVYYTENEPELDAAGNVVGDSHLGCLTDDLFTVDPTQKNLDPTDPVCFCGAEATLDV